MSKSVNVKAGAVLWCFAILLLLVEASSALAQEQKFKVGGWFQQEYAYQTVEANKWYKLRNVLNLELIANISPHLRGFVQIRPVWDGAYDIDDRGVEGRKNIQHNLFNDDRAWWNYEPFFREYWLELTCGKFETRIGQQLVTWGTSDGFRLMDIVNTNNYRDFIKPADEDYKIPNFMLNLNYYLTRESGVQFLIIPRFIESNLPPAENPWGFNVSKALAETEATLKPLGVDFDYDRPDVTPDDYTWGARWSSMIEAIDLNYTINWLYTWDEFPILVPSSTTLIPGVGVPDEFTYKHERVQIFGGTFSYATKTIVPSTIIRGEFIYSKDDTFTTTDLTTTEVDHIDWLIGLDKYFPFRLGPDNSDWWVSAQVNNVYLLDYDDYLGGGLDVLDRYQLGYSLLITTDWLGERLALSWLTVGFDDGDYYTFPKLTWVFSDRVKATLGYFFIAGNKDSLIGEFEDNDTIELYWQFNF